jgi:hypothetical protein
MTRYVKFIDESSIENAPVNYTTETGCTICNFDKSPEMMLEYGYKPFEEAEREPGKEYTVKYREYKTKVKEVLTEVPAEEIARRERERLDQLFLTPSDVERALYYGLGMDFDDLKALIGTAAPSVDLKALAIEFRANNFYRGATDKSGNRLVDMIGLLLNLTTSELDYLFEHKELPQEAIDRLRPQPEPESTICVVCGNDPCTCNDEPEPEEEGEPEPEEEL